MYKIAEKFITNRLVNTQMGLVSEIKKIQSLGYNFSVFLLISTIYILKSTYFLHKNLTKIYKKFFGQYSKGIIGVVKFEKYLHFGTI